MTIDCPNHIEISSRNFFKLHRDIILLIEGRKIRMPDMDEVMPLTDYSEDEDEEEEKEKPLLEDGLEKNKF